MSNILGCKRLISWNWTSYLEDFHEALTPKLPRTASDEVVLERYALIEADINEHSSEKIRKFCTTHNIRFEAAFLAAWALMLNRYCNKDDVVFGIYPQPSKPEETLRPAGAVPVRLKLNELLDLENLYLELESHQHLFGQHSKNSGDFDTNTELFHDLLGTAVGFSHKPLGLAGTDENKPRAETTHPFGLTAQISWPYKTKANTKIEIVYDVDVFDKHSAAQLLKHFKNILLNLVTSKDPSLFEIDMLDSDDRAIIDSLNSTKPCTEPFIAAHERVSQWAEKSPDATAIVCENETLTYGELMTRVENLSRLLTSSGVNPNTIVGLALPQSIDFVVGALAIMKSGGAYLPIDPQEPLDRRDIMIADASVRIIVTDPEFQEHWAEHKTKLVFVNRIEKSADNEVYEAKPSQPNDAAYVIYTSGTTGVPKGVLIEHGSLNNHCVSMAKELQVKSGEVALQFASPVFDVSVEEIFTTLCFGGSLVIGNRKLLSSASQFMSMLEDHEVTILNLPTAFWATLVDAVTNKQAAWPKSVHTLAVGGEKINSDTYTQFSNQGTSHINFINGYGPTETTITSTIFCAPATSTIAGKSEKLSGATLPIGRPINNALHYVLDDQMRLCPPGTEGQLYIGGPGVARGYLQREELTSSRFISLPEINDKAGRFYATGDMVFFDGEDLFYVGRKDHQVKVRGYRVELGEIEASLSRHNKVKESCVELSTEEHGDLVAFVETTLLPVHAAETLKTHLSAQLPDYMIPNRFYCCQKFPLTRAGKIDRKALWENYKNDIASSDSSLNKSEHAQQEPLNELQARLTSICSELIGDVSLALNDSFFEKGGHSLLAVKLFSMIESEFNILIPVREFFSDPTISTLEKLIEEADENSKAAPETANEVGSLHELQSEGDGCPLYCICGVDLYQELATSLGKTQPVYGIFVPVEENLLKAFSENTDAYVLPAMHEIAADYVAVIRENQPFGPYKLAGLSFGGLLAFEIAQQLRASGETVEDLILIDTFVPKKPATFSQIDLKGQWTQLKASKAKYFTNSFKKVVRLFTANRSANKLDKMVTGNERQAKDMDFNLFRALVYGRGAREYSNQIKSYSGDVILIHATDGEGEVNGVNTKYHGWEDIVSGNLQRYEVGGDHIGVLKHPNATLLAETILPYLKSSTYEKPTFINGG